MNKMGIFLDTGFILAFRNIKDENFHVTQEYMKGFLKNEFGQIVTSTFVFDELVTLTLVRTKSFTFAIDIFAFILESSRIKIIEVNHEDFANAWIRFQRLSEIRLSFTDCTIIVQCERLGIENLATIDKHFKGLINIVP